MVDVSAPAPGLELADLKTPPASAGLLGNRRLAAFAARIGAALAAGRSGPFTFGKTVIFASHADVTQALACDLDFRIGPINAHRIGEVNGPFVLGMDRDATLAEERAALYRGLAHLPLGNIADQVRAHAVAKIGAVDGSIDIVRDYARPIATETAVSLFGVEGTSREALMEVARAVFAHTFLNLQDDREIRERALRAAGLMRSWIESEISRRIEANESGDDLIGGMLALESGRPEPDLIRRTVGGMLVGTIDTTVTCVAKIMAVIADDAALGQSIVADLDNPERLAGWCWEVLRRWPHNPILLRSPVEDVMFGDTRIKAGSRIVLWTQAAMLDAAKFPEPHRLRPDRPMAHYLHFGGALHVCAGRAVNGFQIPILVGALLRRGIRKVGKMKWAGPFPDSLPAVLA